MSFTMPPNSLLRSLFLCYFLLLSAADENNNEIKFPLNTTNPKCGLPIPVCSVEEELKLGNQTWCKLKSMDQMNYNEGTILIRDSDFQNLLDSKNCSAFNFNYSLAIPSGSPIMSFTILDNTTLFRCNHNLEINVPKSFFRYNCSHFDIYLDPLTKSDELPSFLNGCSVIKLPFGKQPPHYISEHSDPFTILTPETRIQGKLCSEKQRRFPKAIIKGFAVGAVFGISISLLIILQIKDQRINWSAILHRSRSIYFDILPITSPECVIVNFGVPVFSYEEIQMATNNFDPSRILGSGGFGIVYYGQLKDGREVAVKHLYQRKRDNRHIKQFMNEIQILTCQRHRNLVSLYGCTSPNSHGLLLIYEYISNGTIASNLRGVLAKPALPWPIRMKIAIETASALTHLHACDIIHRDVKSNNILLDNNFCVKVTDFGISRLSPNDVSHVSTRPQGTMGYLDPEYYESCHLTKKSDVYSFGVVLIELISSMQAVDDTRNINEIKLANLAIKKIQRRSFSELVDPSLGFESNNEYKRMIISVAELAFQCLQRNNNLRPPMSQVWEVLLKIESGKDETEPLEVHGGEIS